MEDFIKSFKRYCGGSSVLAGLIGSNLLIFLGVWIVILIGRQFGLEGNFTMPWLCVSSNPDVVLFHPWTLLTYMVIQYDFIHLLFNVLWLFWFGVFIPFQVSEKQRLLLYAGGGFAGALLYVCVNLIWHDSVVPGGYLCGASAAVLAIMTAVAIWSPRREVRLFLIGSVQLKWVALGCMVLTFLGLNGGSGAAQSAHIGGVLFGALFALATARHFAKHPRATTSSAAHAPQRKVRIHVRRNGKAVAEAAANRLNDEGRLDQLLDKIRLSGYSSLTAGERNELNLLSQRLDKK
ncbi:MAG: rhomboid family intramembrane serine protease [Muribaculaceae bacterium]|nr:rhomboid family intramembrane serine protease [Muribaculaceae bacterium]